MNFSVLANLQSIFQSYEDQNFFETVTMEIDLKSASRVVIIGDLNFGGGIPQRNIKEEFGSTSFLLLTITRSLTRLKEK